MISSIPSNVANTGASYAPIGRAPVSQETTDLKSSSFRPTEQLSEAGRGLNRRLPDERPNDDIERERVERGAQAAANGDAEAAVKRRAEQERQQADREQIQELAARDREVRAHEQAHAAVAGQYGSSPTYTFVRGPDGVSYAVGGEVQIDTAPISGDPEATLRKAQQLRRAANAPAEPSGQDSNELRAQQSIEAEQRQDAGRIVSDERTDARGPQSSELEQQRLVEEEAQLRAEQERFEVDQRLLDQRQARAELFSESARRNIDINRRLIEIGVINSGSGVGNFLNRTV
jgi:hypothetical protein